MNVLRMGSVVKVRAPAKLNLFFEVLGKRGDGFHEIETLMVPIGLHDSLTFHPDPGGEIHVDCRWAAAGDAASLGELPLEANNLVTRALMLLRERCGERAGARVELVKSIPAAAGLGGGSSDAAAALVAANLGWNLHWPLEQLADVAAELGSDVPFFLYGGPAICRGRGEQIEPIAGVERLNFVVVRPPQGLPTAAVYRNCQVPAAPARVRPLVDALRQGNTRRAAGLLCNRLEPAAAQITPWIERLRREFAGAGCVAAQMCGSGSSYFGICRHARHARAVAGRLRARGIGRVFAVRS